MVEKAEKWHQQVHFLKGRKLIAHEKVKIYSEKTETAINCNIPAAPQKIGFS